MFPLALVLVSIVAIALWLSNPLVWTLVFVGILVIFGLLNLLMSVLAWLAEIAVEVIVKTIQLGLVISVLCLVAFFIGTRF